MKYKHSKEVTELINFAKPQIEMRPITEPERKRLRELIEVLDTEARHLILSEQTAKKLIDEVLDVYWSTRNYDLCLSWGALNPLEKASVSIDNLKKAEKSFSSLAKIPQNVLLTTFLALSEKNKFDRETSLAIRKVGMVKPETFALWANECMTERLREDGPVCQASKSRHHSFVRKELIEMLYYKAWINGIEKFPKRSRESTFRVIVNALFCALGFKSPKKGKTSTDSDDLITAFFKEILAPVDTKAAAEKLKKGGHQFYVKKLGTA